MMIFFWSTIKNVPFETSNQKSFSQLQLIFLLRNWFWFSWVILKCLEIGKKSYLATNGNTNNFQGLTSFLNIWFFNDFYQKIQHKVLDLEIQLIISIFWVWHLKIGSESKKLSESIKNNTKARKTQVENGVRPKFIYQHLALNKELLKKWSSWWPLHLGPFVPKKKQKRAKSYYSFHWKLKEDKTLILIYLDNLMTIIGFDHLQEVNWGQR